MSGSARGFILSGAFPGAFILDAALALGPSLEAHIFGWPFVAQIVFYWMTVALLRLVDAKAVRGEWRIWSRGGIKIPILLGAEFAAAVGAMDACNVDLTVCHRVFF
ncbi:MAG TPA: hypothetical protein VGR91_05680 [Stellaceae bacterium]|nr:hypothetical protein [Stellaceae bacterium]